MPEIWFYHLERQPLEAVLPRILAGMFARGDRISVHAADRKILDEVSKRLWAIEETSFVVHGFSGEASADKSQILLCTDEISANAATFRFYASSIEPQDVADATRISLFFDGHDEASVAQARERWKKYRGEGCNVKYWKQTEGGRWEDQAVKRAA